MDTNQPTRYPTLPASDSTAANVYQHRERVPGDAQGLTDDGSYNIPFATLYGVMDHRFDKLMIAYIYYDIIPKMPVVLDTADFEKKDSFWLFSTPVTDSYTVFF